MDILLKMKDLQRKIEQIAICIPQGNMPSYNENDSWNCHSSNITVTSPSSKLEFHDFNKTFENLNDYNQDPDNREKLRKPASFYKSTSTAYLAPASSNESQQQLTDRIKRIEINLGSLSKKLDVLIKNIPDQY